MFDVHLSAKRMDHLPLPVMEIGEIKECAMKYPFFIIPFMDERERRQVVAVWAASPEEAIEKVTAYQEVREGLYRTLHAEDVREIEGPNDEGLQILWHQDFD